MSEKEKGKEECRNYSCFPVLFTTVIIFYCTTLACASAQIHTVEHEAENNREAQGCQGE